MSDIVYDAAVIGGGVTGSFALRSLTRAGAKAVLLEAHDDLCHGATRANSAICHAGYDPEPGTLMARLNRTGADSMPGVCQELGVPFRACGSLVLALTPQDQQTLQALYERGVQNGVPELKLLDTQEVLAMEPNLNPELLGALYAPTAGVVSPYELAIAACENAVENGAEVRLNAAVHQAEWRDGTWNLHTSNGQSVRARVVLNAAGASSARIAALMGCAEHQLSYRGGEYLLCDANVGHLVSRVIFQPPTQVGKGILVTQTPDGNLLLGPTSHELTDAEDTATHADQLDEILQTARLSLPQLPTSQIITAFCGVRAQTQTHDFLITHSQNAVHAIGICSPGLTASPAMGDYLVEQLQAMGLETRENKNFSPVRKHAIRRLSEMDWETRRQSIVQNPQYTHVVCRCEQISEAEIVQAIHAPVPAHSVDAIKRRTRAGMGRCQGGFCGPRVMEILARELNVPLQAVNKDGVGSWLCATREGFDA